MKTIVSVFLSFIALSLSAQQSSVNPTNITTPKVISDSLVSLSGDSVRIGKFSSPGARIDNLKSTFQESANYTGVNMNLTGVVAAGNGQFGNLNVQPTGVSNLSNTVTGGNATFSSLKVNNAKTAVPLFTNGQGELSKNSEMLFKTVGAASFHPEIISPNTSGGLQGQISVFNAGELNGSSPSSSNLYRLIAPLEISLNRLSKGGASNIRIQNIKACLYDSDMNNDLAVVLWRVNSSEGQNTLTREPMLAVASDGNEMFYRCFDLNNTIEPEGGQFDLLHDDNSYYLEVYPFQRGEDRISQSTVRAWNNDLPGLKLVHAIVQYIHY